MTLPTSPTAPRLMRRRAAAVLLALGLPGPLLVVTSGPAEAGGPTCAGAKATIVGTQRADTIVGTAGRDVIVAGGGADRIIASAGNDVVCGGGGNDWIDAGSGNDSVAGGAGRDTIVGGAGKDRLSGDGGSDIVDGGPGRDTVQGGPGRDVCAGERRSCERRLVRRPSGSSGTPAGGPTGTPTGSCPATVCRGGVYPTRWVVDVTGHEVRTTATSHETTDWEATVVLVRVGDPKATQWWQQESGTGSYRSSGSNGACSTEASGEFDTFRSELGLVPAQHAYWFDLDAGGPGTQAMHCPGNELTGEGYFDGWAATGGGPVPVPWDLSQSSATGSWHEDGDYLDRDVSWVITPK